MSRGSLHHLPLCCGPTEGSQPVDVVGEDPPPEVDACTIMSPHLAVQPRVLAASQADGSFLSCPPALQPPEPPLVLVVPAGRAATTSIGKADPLDCPFLQVGLVGLAGQSAIGSHCPGDLPNHPHMLFKCRNEQGAIGGVALKDSEMGDDPLLGLGEHRFVAKFCLPVGLAPADGPRSLDQTG